MHVRTDSGSLQQLQPEFRQLPKEFKANKGVLTRVLNFFGGCFRCFCVHDKQQYAAYLKHHGEKFFTGLNRPEVVAQFVQQPRLVCVSGTPQVIS